MKHAINATVDKKSLGRDLKSSLMEQHKTAAVMILLYGMHLWMR
nr:hypothetical protein [Bartonella vinsonii]